MDKKYLKIATIASIVLAVIAGVFLFIGNDSSSGIYIEETASCLPGSKICIDSCAEGNPASCENPGGTPRDCDCEHSWNQA